MKVTKINNTYQKPIVKKSCMQKIKYFFRYHPKGIKIRVLLEDVFDSTLNRRGWFDYLGPSRDLPNCVSGPDEDYDYKSSNSYIKFSPEDEKVLETLEGREYINYRFDLIKKRKYKVVRENN